MLVCVKWDWVSNITMAKTKVHSKKQNDSVKINKVKKNPSQKKADTLTEIKATPRVLSKPTYNSFKLHKRIKSVQPKLPTGYQLLRKTLSEIKINWKLFGGITAIYAVLTLILVRGFSSSVDLQGIKEALPQIYNGHIGTAGIGLTLFGSLLTSSNSATTSEGNVYQSILLIIVSLATIWGLRQVTSGHKPRIRDTFYKGLYPLVPLVLVLLVIGLQLIPMAIGGWLYSVVVVGGIAGTMIEKILWILLIILLVLLSLYMISSSLFALFIVTLPDMEPMRSLRSARQLAMHRRWTILRKIVFLPFVLLLIAALIMLPIIIVLPFIAEWVYYVLSLFGWIVTLCYMYNLYRELLND